MLSLFPGLHLRHEQGLMEALTESRVRDEVLQRGSGKLSSFGGSFMRLTARIVKAGERRGTALGN